MKEMNASKLYSLVGKFSAQDKLQCVLNVFKYWTIFALKVTVMGTVC